MQYVQKFVDICYRCICSRVSHSIGHGSPLAMEITQALCAQLNAMLYQQWVHLKVSEFIFIFIFHSFDHHFLIHVNSKHNFFQCTYFHWSTSTLVSS